VSRLPIIDEASVSVILPTRNVEGNIGRLLNDILNQEHSGDIEVLVLDSSDDRTPEITREYGQRVIRIEPEDYNYGATRNLGVQMTKGEICVFVSADIQIADNQWLRNMLRNFADGRVAGVFSRQIAHQGASPMERFSRWWFYPPQRRVYEYRSNDGLQMDQLFFSNVSSAIRRDVYERYPMPEMLKSEEWVWTRTVLKAGYRLIYEPKSIVYHSHDYSLRQVFREYFDSGASFTAVFPGTKFSFASLVIQGLRYLIDEVRFFAQIRKARALPYAMLYEFIKGAGLLLGTGYRRIPEAIRRRFTKKRDHWDQYEGIIAPGKVETQKR
jgi:rhamnosyltransferase